MTVEAVSGLLVVIEPIVRYQREYFYLTISKWGTVRGRVSIEASAFSDPNPDVYAWKC